jgi:transcription termination factor Rho
VTDEAPSPVAAEPAEATAPTRRRRAASRPAGAPRSDAGQAADDTPEAIETLAAPAAATPAVETPAVETPAVETPAVETPAAPAEPAVPDPAASEPAVSEPAVSEPAASGPAVSGPETDGEPVPRRSRQRRIRGDRPDRADQGENGASVTIPTIDTPTTDSAPEAGADAGRRDGRDNGRDGGRGRGDRGPRTDRTDDRGPRTDRTDDRSSRDSRNDSRTDTRTDTRDTRDDDGDDDGDGRGRRGRRFRDRRRGRDRDRTPSSQSGGQAVDTEVRDDDVLLPVAGIVDILDNYAFVRTTGYLAGPTDVYVSLSMVRRYGLRRGDAVTGAVRQPREGEQSRQKFNPLVRVDTLNGRDPESARNRPEFTKLTPLYPNERLRLETEPHKLTTRVIDLVMPVGKGQRALIVSPPKAGKTTIMQNIANAITTNNPECHLMVVLVDERPEEVTDMQRSVKGEVIASTFDRPPTDHTTVAELSIERAKRLVEMGHDVVVLLDNITRLGRAYNLAAPASGRILSGGVDSTALYPPKRFLGAARNIEGGGSLTIFATALVETGSTMDTVIFEEFKGTGNAELRLDRKIADKRIFPAIDVGDSGTRKEELIMSPDEYAVMVKLRRLLGALDDQQAINLLLDQLRKTRTNIEFLMQVAKNTAIGDD